jgi:uncharacterized protein YhfF
MKLKPLTAAFWQAYVNRLPNAEDAACRFFEVFRIGDSEQSADVGADLIKQGSKTATSSLLWEYEVANKLLPQVGGNEYRGGWERHSRVHRRDHVGGH